MTITDAITSKRIVAFDYDGLPRVVEPHAVGTNKKGQLVLRGDQTGGESATGGLGWKLFNLDKAHSLLTTDQTFSDPREGYVRGDRAMVSILAESMRHNEQSRAIEREVARWPGVRLTFGTRKKHREAILAYQDRERFLIYCGTSGDNWRGLKIKIAELRRMLRDMGAERNIKC